MLCETKKQLTTLVHEIINDGGEGVILRLPKSIFDQGRSSMLIKIKVSSPLFVSSLLPPPFLIPLACAIVERLQIYMPLLICGQATRGDKEAIVVSVAKKSICLKLYVPFILFFLFFFFFLFCLAFSN